MRRRRSGTLNILRTAARNFSITFSWRRFQAANHLPYIICHFSFVINVKLIASKQNDKCEMANDMANAPCLPGNLHHCTASLLDLLSSALSKPVRRDAKRFRDFAVSQHYHVVLRLLNQAPRVQHFRSDLFVGTEVLIECGKTNLQPLLLEDVGKTTLRQTPVQRHLAAFKPDLARITGTRLLSLLTAPRGLAQT